MDARMVCPRRRRETQRTSLKNRSAGFDILFAALMIVQRQRGGVNVSKCFDDWQFYSGTWFFTGDPFSIFIQAAFPERDGGIPHHHS